jgi:CheY-like chemotaxis protein
MPAGGVILVRAENFLKTAAQPGPLAEGPYVKISFRDEGIGIAKEHLSKIFDPYFSLKTKGSGLGLTSTYAIIKRHQGLITVDSELGQGSTFTLYLPASDKQIAPRPKEDDLRIFKGSGRILVMDDEKSILELAEKLLESMGYQVAFAKDGDEAIRSFQESKLAGSPFSLVIMDLTVPGGMGGKETIAHLQRIDPEVKAIVSSGYATDDIMANFRQYGFQGMVAKPYNANQLSRVVYEVIYGEQKPL